MGDIFLVDYRAESYAKRARRVVAARSGYQQFSTAGGKVGAAAGDVLITEGKKEDRLDGGVAVNTVFQSTPSTTQVNDQGQLVRESATGSQVLTQSSSVSPKAMEIFNGRRANVSGGLGARLARESERPMSKRDDANVTYRISPPKRDKYKYNLSSSNTKQEGKNANSRSNAKDTKRGNGSGDNLLYSNSESDVGIGNGSDFGSDQLQALARQSKREKAFEQRVQRLSDWEKQASERQQNTLRFFGYKENGSYLGNLGASALAVPTQLSVGFGEQVALIGAKTTSVIEGLSLKASRGSTLKELGNAAIKTPGRAIQSLNPSTPEGAVNLALLPLAFKAAPRSSVRLVSSDVALRQTVTPAGVVSEGKVFGTVEVAFRKFGIFPVRKTFKVSGDVVETGRVSSVTGLKSGEPIVNTVGSAELLVKGRGVSQSVSSSSVGQEVGGFGNRRVTLQAGGKESNFVEKYAGVTNDDIIYGGGVSKKGVNFFAGKKQLEISGNKIGEAKYFNPETGLESATPTLNLQQESVPTTVKVFSVKSAGQPEIPGSAVLTRRGVTERLLSEKREFDIGNVEPGVVSSVAREQAAAGVGAEVVLSQSSPGVLSGGFNAGELLVKSVEVVQPSKGVGVRPVPVLRGGDVGSESVIINDQKQMLAPSQYAGGAFDVGEVSFVSAGVRPASDVGVLSVVGSSSDYRLIEKGKGDIGSVQDSFNLQSPASSSVLSSKNVNAVEFKPAQISSVAQESSLKSLSRGKSAIGMRTSVNVPSGKIVIPTMNLPKSKGSRFTVEVRRSGKFNVVGSSSELGEAVRLGRSKARSSAARTFRVLQGGKPINVNAGGNFYSKRGGLNIEKSRFAINTRGEVRDISLKGVSSQRRKGRGVLGVAF